MSSVALSANLVFDTVSVLTEAEQDALDELNGRTYDGRELRIKIDEGRPNRPGGGGGGRYDDRDRGGRGGYDDGYRRRERSGSRERRRERSDSRERGRERSRSRSPQERARSGSKDRSKSRSRS